MYITKEKALDLISKLENVEEWAIQTFVGILKVNLAKATDPFRVNDDALARAEKLIDAMKPKQVKQSEIKRKAKQSAKENSRRWTEVQKEEAKRLHQTRNRKVGDPRK